ncbi:MAG: tRNA pseudouridine(55) synthase TruB [Candidatus Sungbacteria bacterium]|nr:tRNA pseudouridine(55) synthase TruB [Candidatus Sungbacteria bacterium]
MSNLSGFILIDKPAGPTSHDVIDQLRKITGIQQIGHAGTLDPFASGLLLIGIGEATKLLRHYVGLDKKYEAILRLGATSDTYDRTGNITETPITRPKADQPLAGKIQKTLQSFIGKQKQVPPMYSAKKVGGKKLYELARAGQDIKREAVDIEVYDIKLVSRTSELVTLNFHVSSGAYIRTLAHDIGQVLGCGAYLEELKRTAIGDFKLEDAVSVIARSPVFGTTWQSYQRTEARLRSNVPQRDVRIASSASTPSRNDMLAHDNWQKHFIPLKTVLVSGTFDGLHEGHRSYFQQARTYGQRLICIVARDSIAEKIKGKKPRHTEKERVAFIKQCPDIDRVYLGVEGPDEKIYGFTASLAPDVIALGYDQKAYTKNLAAEMKKRGLKTSVVRLKPHRAEKFKSSILNKTRVDKTSQNR